MTYEEVIKERSGLCDEGQKMSLIGWSCTGFLTKVFNLNNEVLWYRASKFFNHRKKVCVNNFRCGDTCGKVDSKLEEYFLTKEEADNFLCSCDKPCDNVEGIRGRGLKGNKVNDK
jgi:hypothetical protein